MDVTSADQLKDLNIGTQVDSAALEMLEGNEEYDSFKDKLLLMTAMIQQSSTCRQAELM